MPWAILGWQNGSLLAKVAILLHPCLVTISKGLPSTNSKPESLFYLFLTFRTQFKRHLNQEAFPNFLPLFGPQRLYAPNCILTVFDSLTSLYPF